MDFKNLMENPMNEMETIIEKMREKPDLARVPQIKATLCHGTESGEEFADTMECLQRKDKDIEPRKIKGLLIRSSYIVDGIQVLYEDGEAKFHGNSKGGGEHWIEFDKGDELKRIEGVWDVPYGGGGAISWFLIHTKKGKFYGPFGQGKQNKTFCIEIPAGASFVGFFGRAKNGGFLAKLGLLYYEKK